MKKRVQLDLLVPSVTAAKAVRDWVKAKLAELPISITDVAATWSEDEGAIRVSADVRYAAGANLGAMWTALKDKMSTTAAILSGSRVAWHNCDHDGAAGPCHIDGEYVKP